MAQVASWIVVVTINLCVILQSSSPLFATRVASSYPTTEQDVSTEPAVTNSNEETDIISRFCSKTKNSKLCNSYGKSGSHVLMADVEERMQSLGLAMSITSIVKDTTDIILKNAKIQSKFVPLIITCQASYIHMFISFRNAWASSSDLQLIANHLKVASRSLDHCNDALATGGKDPSILNLKVINQFLEKFVDLSDIHSPIEKNN